MKKKHFVALAQALKDVAALADLSETQHRLTAQAVADVCEKDNKQFDYQRFLTACGVSKEAN